MMAYLLQEEDQMPLMLGPARVRVVVQHTPHLYAMLGLHDLDACPSTLQFDDSERTFYRAQSTPRWVLYKPAVQGHGEATPLHRNQR